MSTDITAALRDLVRSVVSEVLAEERAATLTGVQLLTTAGAAEVLGVKPATVRTMIRDGRIKAQHLGRSLRISRIEIDAVLSAPRIRGKETVLGPAEKARRDVFRLVRNRDGNR